MAVAAESTSSFHTFDKKKKAGTFSPLLLAVLLIAILLGIVSGYSLSMSSRPAVHMTSSGSSTSDTTALKPGDIIGSSDTGAFKDSAEGVLQVGGIDNEGQFHLVRPGGDSQNVYLTSSSVDLSRFVKHKIKVWGATQTAKTAGWLMDVGRVEVLE